MYAQRVYFGCLATYLILLVAAAAVAYLFPQDANGAIASALLFLITLAILVFLKVKKPENTWYNGRAVAESVKSRSWRWMMKAEPYIGALNEHQAQRDFLSDVRSILKQNESLSEVLVWSDRIGSAVTKAMVSIRSRSWEERLSVYERNRIVDQQTWYSTKALSNRRKGTQLFVISVLLHSAAVVMLLTNIKGPFADIPVEVVATAASAILSWAQARKFSELSASYGLAAHEIVLVQGEVISVQGDEELSEFVINSETAFSREHIQWVARKTD